MVLMRDRCADAAVVGGTRRIGPAFRTLAGPAGERSVPALSVSKEARVVMLGFLSGFAVGLIVGVFIGITLVALWVNLPS
jgi:hypothetical protein